VRLDGDEPCVGEQLEAERLGTVAGQAEERAERFAPLLGGEGVELR
jgi:hypothetical protein